jgi:hypothetical protein
MMGRLQAGRAAALPAEGDTIQKYQVSPEDGSRVVCCSVQTDTMKRSLQ